MKIKENEIKPKSIIHNSDIVVRLIELGALCLKM